MNNSDPTQVFCVNKDMKDLFQVQVSSVTIQNQLLQHMSLLLTVAVVNNRKWADAHFPLLYNRIMERVGRRPSPIVMEH